MQLKVAIFCTRVVTYSMSIGERISQLRTQQNISQGQLADMLEVSRQAVSKWENDLSSPDTIRLIKLADVLGTDVEYLATGRNTYGRRPPVVLETVKTVEKVVEVPVVQVVEKVVEKVIEKPTVEYVEKPVIKKIYRTRVVRNTWEIVIVGAIALVAGILIGLLF